MSSAEIPTTPLEAILGSHYLSPDGDRTDVASLRRKKAVILYFSAHWCPPCRAFTPVLSDAYGAYKSGLAAA
eukprot:CAMPEP_0183308366 /NCGR_PEP_ID=MMETSP0160_2-20130417/21574_1 /TAXON_ID=2839 ORGANISM="Odontella Sinensis, Strain Grunow 1884" /NCGR_SAMPLE_ID=MMETSP0160_2 /ASSEMBLY_ACC=CAM_ASM_000250 /LENGTH=71 /DNA_ID=CAMNT_0025472203 /DNA_START=95 /DNA_END=307 /DNA_ORIENTATION=-